MLKVTKKIHDRIRTTTMSLILNPVPNTDIFLRFNKLINILNYSTPTMYQIYDRLCVGPTKMRKPMNVYMRLIYKSTLAFSSLIQLSRERRYMCGEYSLFCPWGTMLDNMYNMYNLKNLLS